MFTKVQPCSIKLAMSSNIPTTISAGKQRSGLSDSLQPSDCSSLRARQPTQSSLPLPRPCPPRWAPTSASCARTACMGLLVSAARRSHSMSRWSSPTEPNRCSCRQCQATSSTTPMWACGQSSRAGRQQGRHTAGQAHSRAGRQQGRQTAGQADSRAGTQQGRHTAGQAVER